MGSLPMDGTLRQRLLLSRAEAAYPLKKLLVVNYAEQHHTVSWYSGASDEAIGRAVVAALALPSGAHILVRDPDDQAILVLSDSLPTGLKVDIELAGVQAIQTDLTVTAHGHKDEQHLIASSHKLPHKAKPTGGNAGLGDEGDGAEGQEFRTQLLKFERVNAHLANERTLLAWIRTALSVLTVAVAFIALAEELSAGAEGLAFLVGISFAAITMLTYFTGWARYSRVKEVLSWQGPQLKARFRRIGLRWQAYSLGITLCCSVMIYVAAVVAHWSESD